MKVGGLFARLEGGAGSNAGAPPSYEDDPASAPAQAALRFGGPLFRGARPGAMRASMGLIWLAFIVFPLVNALTNRGSAAHRALTFAGAAAFVAAYLTLVLSWRRRSSSTVNVALFAIMGGCASALTLSDPSSWAFLFTYAAACGGLLSSAQVGFYAVATCTALAAGESLIAGASGGAAIGYAASAAGIGLLLMVMRDLRVRNEELVQARAELAKLAVAAERERFARDLHDLLGHSLSVITLKAELAGRLLPDKAAEAAREVAEVEEVARKALSEVREAVSGYRQPTLDGELEGALMALSAAGIDASVERPAFALDPEIEAVLAWTVREGATNVIRHSHARHVKVRVSASLTDAGVEVVDDGVGADDGGSEARDTHGLAGLAERARSVAGHLEAGAQPGGGYRLAVSVPTGRA